MISASLHVPPSVPTLRAEVDRLVSRLEDDTAIADRYRKVGMASGIGAIVGLVGGFGGAVVASLLAPGIALPIALGVVGLGSMVGGLHLMDRSFKKSRAASFDAIKTVIELEQLKQQLAAQQHQDAEAAARIQQKVDDARRQLERLRCGPPPTLETQDDAILVDDVSIPRRPEPCPHAEGSP